MTDPRFPTLPPDALELLEDPQLADLRPRAPGLPRAGKTLRPTDPGGVEHSPFVIFQTNFEYLQDSKVVWTNTPWPPGFLGAGNGFASLLNNKPRFTQEDSKPARPSTAWGYSAWMICSDKFAAIVRAFDPGPIETADIEWLYDGGERLEGYVFLDVTRLLHAYDYRRSVVNVQMSNTGKLVISSVSVPRALKPDLPAEIHIFREAYWRSQVFVSRKLAKALLEADLPGFYFEEPGTGAWAKL